MRRCCFSLAYRSVSHQSCIYNFFQYVAQQKSDKYSEMTRKQKRKVGAREEEVLNTLDTPDMLEEGYPRCASATSQGLASIVRRGVTGKLLVTPLIGDALRGPAAALFQKGTW